MFPWNRLAAFLPTGLLQGVTSSGLSTPDIDRPLGEAAVVRSSVGGEGRPRGQRVLDGLSGARAEGQLAMVLGVTDTVSCEIRDANAAMIP
jgi:hypothetical protein